jgi:hypothetical protein
MLDCYPWLDQNLFPLIFLHRLPWSIITYFPTITNCLICLYFANLRMEQGLSLLTLSINKTIFIQIYIILRYFEYLWLILRESSFLNCRKYWSLNAIRKRIVLLETWMTITFRQLSILALICNVILALFLLKLLQKIKINDYKNKWNLLHGMKFLNQKGSLMLLSYSTFFKLFDDLHHRNLCSEYLKFPLKFYKIY